MRTAVRGIKIMGHDERSRRLPWASAGLLHAQGLDGLSQLLHGFQQSHSSGRSGTAVTVERGAAPYMGEFIRTETTTSGTHTLSSRVACYPARDPAFTQTETFVCYTAQSSTN